MLAQLSISNYAIIDQLTIHPGARLNIVTGETGAGKSIILGALSLILGERADTSVLINKEQKCVVEASFETAGNEAFEAALRAHELDIEHPSIIRREISSSGKSRAFINDTPVNLSTLAELTGLLVDLHQQFDNRSIEDEAFQMSVLDITGDSRNQYHDYRKRYTVWQNSNRNLNELKARQAQLQKETDYKQFLFDELEQANLKPDEIEQAESKLKQLSGAERIINTLQQARFALEEGEAPIIGEIRRQSQQLQQISEMLPAAATLQSRLHSAYEELRDIASELSDLEEQVYLDPEQMAILQDRFDLGMKLLKKHAVNSTASLLDIWSNLSDELKGMQNLQAQIAELEQASEQAFRELSVAAEQLSKSRQQCAPQLSAQLSSMLAEVGMPNAQFQVQLTASDKPGPLGMDIVSFRLDANRSGQYQPIAKAASGGEKSRIALCVKSLIAKAVALPTLIFDEVDTGISGEAARKVGALLEDLSAFRQVICITHQPQVAAKGETHFYVYKEEGSTGKIGTHIRTLNRDEKVFAIARMIGGEQPSEAALSNARELIEH